MVTDFIKRRLSLTDVLKSKSVLLLGPRQTGKSTLLQELYPAARFVNLLEADVFRDYAARPETLRQSLKAEDRLIVIDEIQKLPELLDEVQLMIDRDKSLRFILTGSSARKLKRGKANLLGGRAIPLSLHPLVLGEAGVDALETILQRGGLPGIYSSPAPERDLKAYVGVYLKEEIQSEGLTRNLPQFTRFLEVAALSSGEQINYTAVGSDCGINPRTVRDHFQILYDTLVAAPLPAYTRTKKRKAVATEKFYFFDIGVSHALVGRQHVAPGTPEYGKALEHLVFLELTAYGDYSEGVPGPLSYWRSSTQAFEVDFIVGNKLALEVKAKTTVTDADLKGLRALREEKQQKKFICVSRERVSRRTDDGIHVITLADFVGQLWSGELLG